MAHWENTEAFFVPYLPCSGIIHATFFNLENSVPKIFPDSLHFFNLFFIRSEHRKTVVQNDHVPLG